MTQSGDCCLCVVILDSATPFLLFFYSFFCQFVGSWSLVKERDSSLNKEAFEVVRGQMVWEEILPSIFSS